MDFSEPQALSSERPKEIGLDIWELLRSFRRRWLLCLLLGLPLGAAAAIGAYLVLPAPYVAESEVYMKSFEDNLIFDTKERQANFSVRKQTHLRLVTSRPVLTAALRQPEVAQLPTLTTKSEPVEWLAKNLSVGGAGEEFFKVKLSGDRPTDLPKIVNAVTEAYISEVVVAEQQNRRSRLSELEKVSARVAEELQLKREELRKLTEATSSSTTTMFDQKQEFLLNLNIELRKQLAQVELEMLRLRVRDNVLSKIDTDVEIPDSILQSYVIQEPEYALAESRVNQYRRLLARTERDLAPGHPRTTAAQADLTDAEAKLAALAQSLRPRVLARLEEEQKQASSQTADQSQFQATTLAATKAELERELDRTKSTERETGLYSLDLDALTKEIGRLEAMSDSLAVELDRREFELKNARLPASVLQKAIVPQARDTKKRDMGTAAAGGGVLGLVALAICFFDSRGGRISTRNEVSDRLSMRLIATIPAVPRSAMNDAPTGRGRKKAVYWHSALKESVSAARTMLLAQADHDDRRVIMIASAVPAEGKTTLSLHLATSLARGGRRVVLVDADLRRPSLSHVYGHQGAGVCEILRGEATIEDSLHEGNIEGLSILAAGTLDDVVLQRLAEGGMAPLFEELRNQFDIVIVDSSPVLPLCDALLVAKHADAVLFAIRRDVSRIRKVAAAVDQFRSIGVPVLGAVAIGMNDDPVGYHDMYRYRQRYGYAEATTV